jgi:Glucosidase II beta subunit-like protein
MTFSVSNTRSLAMLVMTTSIKTFALEGFGHISDLFPNHAEYDHLIIDPYHIYGSPYGGFSRSTQSRLASLPLHLTEILEDVGEGFSNTDSDPLFFEVRDVSGRLFSCRLYHEDELMPESLYDSMFDTPILRKMATNSEQDAPIDTVGKVSDRDETLPTRSILTDYNKGAKSSTSEGDSSLKIYDTQNLEETLESKPENKIEASETISEIVATTESTTSSGGALDAVVSRQETLHGNAKSQQHIMMTLLEIDTRLQELQSICGQIHKGWWSYEWCYGESITQFHIEYKVETNTIQLESVIDLGHYKFRKIALDDGTLSLNEYAEGAPELARVTDVYDGGNVCDETGGARITYVNMICCSDKIAEQHKGMLHKQGHPVTTNVAVFVDIEEDPDVLCSYNVTICTPLLCGSVETENDTKSKSEYRVLSRSNPIDHDMNIVKENESIREILDRVLSMLCLQSNLGGWWTYEICYKQSIRQFHEGIGTKRNSAGANVMAKIAESEHILGVYDPSNERTDILDEEEWKLVVNVTTPGISSSGSGNLWGEGSGAYYEIEYTSGDVCDHTDVTDAAIVAGSTSGIGGGVERSSTVRFFCGEMYDVAVHEDSTCHYIVQVKVPALCQHRLFRAPSAKKQLIKCLPIEDE